MVAVAAGVAGWVALTYGSGIVLRRLGERALRRQARGRLVLTYDDGPRHNSLFPDLLQVLERYGARATFFVVGFRAADSPELVDELERRGHEVGSHGYWHRDAWRAPWAALKDAQEGVHATARWSRRKLFRPPRGKMTLWSWSVFRWESIAPVFWTIDSADSRQALPSLEEASAKVERSDGGVVLLHDHDAERTPRQAEYTLRLTERLLELARQKGWKSTTVGDMLGYREPRSR